MNTYETIISMADAMVPEMTLRRRDLHKHAETGWFEMRTTSLIARELTVLGYEVLVGDEVCLKEARMGVPSPEKLAQQYARAAAQGADPEFLPYTKDGMTGVIGILRCGKGPTVAMRFDIDALGVIEETDSAHIPAREGFASVNPGFMHACGHDGHATIGLGVAKILMALKDKLHGTVKLIFQPAEEGVRGAKSIVEKGHLDDVDFLIGNHITGVRPDHGGAQVVTASYGSLATTKLDVLYRGRSAHAGVSPHLGSSALLAAAAAVMNLNAIPRHGGGATRINVGTLHAGSGRNVIADEAKMELEIRGADTQINEYMTQYAQRILEAAAEMHGCSCRITLMGAAESMRSDPALADRIRRSAETLGIYAISPDPKVLSASGSEDFSYMMNRVQSHGGQAVFMRTLTPVVGGAHNRSYDFDESVLPLGVKVFCAAVYDLMK